MKAVGRIVLAACLLSGALFGCRSTGAPAPATSSSALTVSPECPPPPKAAASAAAPEPEPPFDPFAPVIAPGPDRPSRLRSITLPNVRAVGNASSFRAPSAKHPDGTLVAMAAMTEGPDRLLEIDVRSSSVVHSHDSGDFRGDWLAATEHGIIVNGDESGPEEVFQILDSSYRLKKTLREREWSEPGMHADGSLAAIYDGRMREIMTVDLVSGEPIARRKLAGDPGGGWSRPQVVVNGDRVFALARAGKTHFVLRLLSRDLKLIAEKRIENGSTLPDYMPSYRDALLAHVPQGAALVLNANSLTIYDRDLRVRYSRAPSDSFYVPAVDPSTGRVLFESGMAAASLQDERAELSVVFRRDRQPKAPYGPTHYNHPIFVAFMNEKGVIITNNPGARLTVVEWEHPPQRRSLSELN